MLNNTTLARQFDRVNEIIEAWSKSAEPVISWRGGMRKCLSKDAFDALEALASIAGTESQAVHQSGWRLMLIIDGFAREWVRFTDLSRAGADIDPAGSPELWAAYSAIRENLIQPEFKQPEPIEQLARREQVPAWQIAKIYGWGDDVKKVQEELDQPGTHYDPKTWVHPAKAQLEAEVAAKWARRIPVDVPQVNLPEEKKPAPVAPESLETLIQQRVPVEQIARMKQITVSEVEQKAAMMGVVLTGARFVRPATLEGIAEEILADEKSREENFEREQNVKSADEAEKLKAAVVQRIKSLRKSGKSPAEIQEVIRGEFPSIDASQLA